MKHFFSIILFFLICQFVLFSGLAVASPDSNRYVQEYQSLKSDYLDLKKSKSKRLYRHNWTNIISELAAFEKKEPQGSLAASSRYLIARAYQNMFAVSRVKSDALKAIENFERVEKVYPKSTLVDDSLYWAATIHENVFGSKGTAYKFYDRATKVKNGDYNLKATNAKERLGNYAPRNKKTPAKKPKKNEQGTRIDSININHDHVFIETDGTLKHKTSTLPAISGPGSRVVFDFKANLNTGVPAKKENHPAFTGVRAGKQKGGTSRIVIETKINDDKATVHKVVGGYVLSTTSINSTSSTRDTALSTESEIALGEPDGRLIIVIDAGHGGKDPGAVGKTGLKEKDVTLELAKRVANDLRSSLGATVYLTRSTDKFVPLKERTAYANKKNADLFLSIHANASQSRQANGIETYYLNFSKSDAATKVAARENDMSIADIDDLDLILLDLVASAKINESSRLAHTVQNKIIKSVKEQYGPVNDHGVKEGPFHVLLGANMPSVLIEAAFISNSKEEKRLKSDKYLSIVSNAISTGVKNYLQPKNLVARTW